MRSDSTFSFYYCSFFFLSALAAAPVVIRPACAEQGGNAAAVSFYESERNDLVRIRDSLTSTVNLHSNWTGPPCYFNRTQWIGITCSGSHAARVVLDNSGLTGSLPPGAFQNMTFLSVLDLRRNALRGPLPALSGLPRLQIVLLSHNRFSGSIPAEFTALPTLTMLELQDNLISGSIPALDQPALLVLNVSYNFLQGPVPETPAMRRFPKSSYEHNLGLCGAPLDRKCPEAEAPPPPAAPADVPPPGPVFPDPPAAVDRRLKLWDIVLISFGAFWVSLFVMMFFLCCHKWCHHNNGAATKVDRDLPRGDIVEVGKAQAKHGKNAVQSNGIGELEFFEKERAAFDINELLRASAEVLGKGRMGTTYQTVLETGVVVTVKRLKETDGVSRKEFVQHMQVLGRLRHENQVEIIACYYSRNEKLVVTEYVPGGKSLFELLHENRGAGRVPLSWSARLTVSKGIARAMEYLHRSLPSHSVPHGNLKSTNVIASIATATNHRTKLTDFGLLSLLRDPASTGKLAVAKTPEFALGKKLNRKSDVYCLGLVLLELITGRRVPGDDGGGLVGEWVRKVANGGRLSDVIDLEILGEKDCHGEMTMILRIALECTMEEADQRPAMGEVLKKIEEIER